MEGRPTVALAGPPVEVGKLVAPRKPHSSLVLGDDSHGLGLLGGRASLQRSLLLYPGQIIQKVPLGSRTAGRELPLLLPRWGAWKLLWRPRPWALEMPYSLLSVLLPGIQTTIGNWRSCRGWHWGCQRLGKGTRWSVRRKSLGLPALTSTPLLFRSIGSQRHSTGDGLVPAWLAATLCGGGLDKRPTLPQNRLLPNIKSQHLPVTSDSFHAIIDQACYCSIETPDYGVQSLHPLTVPGMTLLYGNKDPNFDLLRDRVQKEGC